MVSEKVSLADLVFSLLEDGKSREDIEMTLREQGHDDKFIKDLVAEVVKLRYSKRRMQGLMFIMIGAVVCFLSFLLTITASYTSTSFPWVLYGLTSAGVLLLFAGFVKIF